MPLASSDMRRLRPSILSVVSSVTAKLSPLPTNLITTSDLPLPVFSLSTFNNSDDIGPPKNASSTLANNGFALPSGAMSFVYLMYALTVFMTVVGNITVIIVFTRGRRSRTDIRGFLVNLAISDLVVGIVCLPFSSVVPQLGWIFPDLMCPLVLFAQQTSVTASIYINAAIGIDRFLAVRFPFKRLTASRSRVAAIIAVIWISATGLASVQLVVSRASVNESGERLCSEIWPDPEFAKHYSIILLVITYIAPVALVAIMYTLVCQQLWSTNHPGAADALRDSRQLKAKRKVVKMLIVIVALCTVCWLPLHIFFLLYYFWPKQFEAVQPGGGMLALYYFVHLLAMSNSFQNPIIYGFLNDNFRSDLSEMLILCCPFFSRFDAMKKAASRQQSSTSRHCSFHRQQSDRCPVQTTRAAAVVATCATSRRDCSSGCGHVERHQLQSRRRQHEINGADFAIGQDSSATMQLTTSDSLNVLGIVDALRLDDNDNSTLNLLKKVIVLRSVLEAPRNAVKPPRVTRHFEHDIIPGECSRNEEVAETVSFVSP